MGSLFHIVLYHYDSTHAAKSARSAFSRIEKLDSIMSDYIGESELNRLSATAGSNEFVQVSDDLYKILAHASHISRKTSGAFDITVGPLTKLWRRSFRQNMLPDSVLIEKAKQVVNYKYVHFNTKETKVKLEKVGMSLDLGGIAKGYAADEAMKILMENHIPIALVDAGGDLVLGAPPPNKRGWVVEIQHRGTEKSSFLWLSNVAVATSGDLYRFLEVDGRRFSHIIDPISGYGLKGSSFVTVIARNGMLADALASALSVLGSEKGFKKIRCLHNPAAMIVRIHQDKHMISQNRKMKKLLRSYTVDQ